MDDAAEHGGVHLHGLDDEQVQKFAEDAPQGCTDEGQQDVFTINVFGDFQVVKAQHFEGGKFPFPLGDVDGV